ncbi:MAG: lycopene cyclase [Ignavibacteriae bacterium HGW-Ignavibacteriae-4]|jgi:lycopene beta-cyclase|nr:MAG: lycopene cyclase [Ignavibacteriae bacterium HGW-Ignavibacteriae-4]
MKMEYDIIVCGGGMSGLSLSFRAIQSGVWANKSILIIDKSDKSINDRTWCFWENSLSPFEEIIFRKWVDMCFFSVDNKSLLLDTGDYSYNMIRSIDFYNYTLDYLKSQPNVTITNESIISMNSIVNGCEVVTDSNKYQSEYVFNSIYKKPKLEEKHTYLLQHFKGVIIESNDLGLDTKQIYLMDFRTSQENGNTFFYVLPTSETTALVEYTLFSDKLLPKEVYDQRIEEYIREVLRVNDYKIIESEFGVIPMTDYSFVRTTGNIINLGTIGGDTRGSTGYTFTNTQKTITKIINSYQENGKPHYKEEHISTKHKLYDSTLLKVLADGKYQGHQLFTDMFSSVKATDILAFLDGESSLKQDFKVIKSLIPQYFIKPFFRSWLNR